MAGTAGGTAGTADATGCVAAGCEGATSPLLAGVSCELHETAQNEANKTAA